MKTKYVFITLAVIIFTILLFVYIKPPKVTVGLITRTIENEISIGDHYEKIIEFLNKNGIDHSGIIDHRDEKIIQGIIRDVKKTPFVTTDLYLVFKFNEESNLISYDVKYTRTSF